MQSPTPAAWCSLMLQWSGFSAFLKAHGEMLMFGIKSCHQTAECCPIYLLCCLEIFTLHSKVTEEAGSVGRWGAELPDAPALLSSGFRHSRAGHWQPCFPFSLPSAACCGCVDLFVRSAGGFEKWNSTGGGIATGSPFIIISWYKENSVQAKHLKNKASGGALIPVFDMIFNFSKASQELFIKFFSWRNFFSLYTQRQNLQKLYWYGIYSEQKRGEWSLSFIPKYIKRKEIIPTEFHQTETRDTQQTHQYLAQWW